ncbi:MAG: hypothetical protein LBL98_06870 [Ruminococcus sp.]|nr:hypothetical protein [Ruminococcus sp.]
MTFKRCFTKELLSIKNSVIYLFVLLYIMVYLLGYLGVLPAFSGNFLTPVSILIYAMLSAFLSAKFTSREPETSLHTKYKVIRNAATGELLLPVSEISTGDCICLSGGEYIPLSGDVVAGEAYVYERGELVEKRPASGRARKESYYVNAGTAVYAGSITVEVSIDKKAAGGKNRRHFDKKDIFSWTFIGSAIIGIAIFLIRFIIGRMVTLGTYEAVLDNLVLVFAIISLSSPFCSDSDYLPKVFAKFTKINVSNREAVFTAGKVNNIAVDAKLFYPFSEPAFFAVTSENSVDYQNVTDINVLPAPLKGLITDNIKMFGKCRSENFYSDADMLALRRFVEPAEHETDLEGLELLTEIPFLPESGYAAVTFRKNGVIATEYYGKPDFFEGSSILGETGREELTAPLREKLTGAINLLSREGKRIRLLAVNHGRIKNGELPTTGWLILGYFVFPAVPTFAVKKAINTAADAGIQISLLPTYETEIYDEYLINTLRLSGKYTPDKDKLALETASIVYDIASVLPKADVKIAPSASSNGVRKTADIVTNTGEVQNGFFDAVDILERSKKFSMVYKILGALTGIILIAMFVFFAFVLRPLPVAFGDDIIPVMMFLSLLLGLSETLLLKNT